jgi:hypothetical protein
MMNKIRDTHASISITYLLRYICYIYYTIYGTCGSSSRAVTHAVNSTHTNITQLLWTKLLCTKCISRCDIQVSACPFFTTTVICLVVLLVVIGIAVVAVEIVVAIAVAVK